MKYLLYFLPPKCFLHVILLFELLTNKIITTILSANLHSIYDDGQVLVSLKPSAN